MKLFNRFFFELSIFWSKLSKWPKTLLSGSVLVPMILLYGPGIVKWVAEKEISKIYDEWRAPGVESSKQVSIVKEDSISNAELLIAISRINQMPIVNNKKRNLEMELISSIKIGVLVHTIPELNLLPYSVADNREMGSLIRTYCTDKVFLRIYIDKESLDIEAYLVIAKDHSIRPMIPTLGKRLGSFAFNQVLDRAVERNNFETFRTRFLSYTEETLYPWKGTYFTQTVLGLYSVGYKFNNLPVGLLSSSPDWESDEAKQKIERVKEVIQNRIKPNMYAIARGNFFYTEDRNILPIWYDGGDMGEFFCQ